MRRSPIFFASDLEFLVSDQIRREPDINDLITETTNRHAVFTLPSLLPLPPAGALLEKERECCPE